MKSLVIVCLLEVVFGWWSTGHMLVAQIAQNVLQQENPEVLSIANQILSPLYGPLTHGISSSFVESAVWCDDIKSYNFDVYNNWHFIDKPYNYDGFANATTSGEDILFALSNSIWTLQSQNYSVAILETSIALRYVLHFMGDYHQPLHVTNFWSRNFTQGDEGGNLFPITFDNQINELHALWDSCMGVWADDLPRPLNSDGWYNLNMWAEWCTGNNTKQDLASELAIKELSLWQYDTYRIAIDYAYYGIKPNEKPSEEYLKRGWKIVLKQLALGGYRLANLLISLFGQTSALS
ncbi:unnamed protein product [Blepharisma stoltei]|uniref:Aspergillus nuclease S(1) n=1 Tax=Blepharisma stoltei TaxID=1481888 RepID=A0AAU9J0E0_9CILI|nr:unnamed protein product [Blepharisma stoltei]